jgi:hypothetical protein
MTANPDNGPIDHIVALAHEIIEECSSCTRKAAQIAIWAGEIRERRPGREELEALVDGT